MRVIFWCEFPEQLNFKKLNSAINFNTEIYFAASSRKEFMGIRRKIKNKNISVGAWPILEKKDGYWFSGFVSRKCIDKLDSFKGINIKIDIEPPIYNGRHSLIKDFFWLARYSTKKGENNDYLRYKTSRISSNLIISGFLLPKFIRKRYGHDINNGVKNYICYTTFFLRILRPLARFFLIRIIKRMRKDNFYAVGLANPGIFKNEPDYESIEEFKADIAMMKTAKIQNLCIYSIEGILKRKDSNEWLSLIKLFLSDR